MMKFPHLLRPPLLAPAENPPLLLLLHGKGADESDLFALARHFDPRLNVLSLRAPHQIAPGYYRWYERFDSPQGSIFDEREITASLDWLLDSLDQACRQLKPPAGQVHLLGFSQGGAMALSLALRAPQQLASVISIAGRILPAATLPLARMETVQHLKILLQHGAQDDLVPAAESQRAGEYFAALGLQPAQRQYAAGHTISPAMLRDALNFLQSCLG